MDREDIAIEVKNLHKDFVLPHEKTNSVKSVFTSFGFFKKRKYEKQHALNGIDFTVKKGEFFGIVGRNGSGKSTLLKLLAGIYQPTKGNIRTNGKIVPFIELGVGFNPELSGRDNVYLNGAMLGFSDKEVEKKYQDIVDFAELERFMDQKLKNYSSGMQVRLAFSVATILAESDILLIDEVLAVGDADFQRKCFSYFKTLKRNNKTVVFVTHDMGAVKEFCDKALLIDKSKIAAIGKPGEIADLYSRMFLESYASDEEEHKSSKRWGTHDAKYTNVTTEVNGDNIYIRATIKAKKRLADVLFGIHITGEDGRELTAMNNRMIKESDIKILDTEKDVLVEWKMLNVFNDGKFYVTLTLADAVSTVYDWYQEAQSFSVKRIERSTTPILPPVSAKIKLKK